MASKLQIMTAVCEEETLNVCKNADNWMRFLTTAANNYKYRFKDQIMIYAQKPEATACAEIETWNKLGRWVNKGTRGIALLIDRDIQYKLRHVFDISDTNSYYGNSVSLWQMNDRYESAVTEALVNSFGEIESDRHFTNVLISTAENVVTDNLTDYLEQLKAAKESSFLSGLDDFNVEVILKQTLTNSVAYMLIERCGLEGGEFFTKEDFPELYQFSSPEVIAILGGATSDISEMVLREIEETVRIAQRIEKSTNRTFANPPQKEDNIVRNKESERSEHNEDHLHETGRLRDSRSDSTRKPERSWEVWNAEEDLPQRSQGRNLHGTSDNKQAERSPSGDRPTGNRDDGGADEEVSEASGRIGEAEGRGSDALGTADEQHQEPSGRNSPSGDSLPLSGFKEYFRTEVDYFHQDSEKNELIRNCPQLNNHRVEIATFFKSNPDNKERGNFLRSFIYAEPYQTTLENGVGAGFRAYSDCIHLWRGDSFETRERDAIETWDTVARRVYGMMLIREWLNPNEPVFPTEDEQIRLIESYAQEKSNKFTLPQEAIDYILRGGSGFVDGRLRIYRQFSKKETADKNIAFLKNEYGTGGRSDAIPGSGYWEDHDAKGIRISANLGMPERQEVLLSWSAIEKRLKQLIAADRYLTDADKDNYAAYLKRIEEQDGRNKIVTEFRSIIEDFNDYETQLGNKDACLDRYRFAVCTSDYNAGLKRTGVISENNFVIPMMRNAMEHIIAERTHLTERCEAMLVNLSDDYAKSLEPTYDELNPPPPAPKEYKFSLGDTVYIGADEYDILSLDGDTILLYDEKYPIFNKEMSREEFYAKVTDSPFNDKYLVEVEQPVPENGEPTKDDLFFAYPKDNEVIWMYYNPDAEAGGQYVAHYLTFENIRDAAINQTDVDSFFDTLGGYALTELTDVGDSNYEATAELFKGTPTFAGLTEETMDALLEMAGAEILPPVFDRETEILYNVLSKLKIDDIELSFNDDGELVAEEKDYTWIGKDFYDFLANEAFVYKEDGSVLGISDNLLADFKALAEHHGVIMSNSQYSPLYREYLEVKADNPNNLVLFQVGDFFEAFNEDAKTIAEALDLMQTTRPIGNSERATMVGLPRHILETYLNMLTDRGFDVTVSALDNGVRNSYTLSSQSKDDPVDSYPIGRINYLHTNGDIRESIEYTSEYQLKKDIREENHYGVPMTVDIYADKDGTHIDMAYLNECDPPLQGVSVIPSPYIQLSPLEKAKEIIDNYCRKEYEREDGADYSNLSKVEVAYTTTEDEKHEIQANVNLVNFKIETAVDGIVVRSENYQSLEDLIENGLQGMTFDDLVYVPDDELYKTVLSPDRFSIRLHPNEGGITGIWDAVLDDFCRSNYLPLRFAEQDNAIKYLSTIQQMHGIKPTEPIFTTPLGKAYRIGDGVSSQNVESKNAIIKIDRVDEDNIWYTVIDKPEQEAVNLDRTAFERYLDTGYFFIANDERANKPEFRIGFSEHPAFYERRDGEFVDRYNNLSFALGNYLLGVLDEKQHRERDTKDIGWYHKTDFYIKAKVGDEDFDYEGRFDIGDGEGDLIQHIKNYYNYYLSEKNPFISEWKSQGEDFYNEKIKSLQNGLNVLVPFLESQKALSQEDKVLFNEIMSHEPEWFVGRNQEPEVEEPEPTGDLWNNFETETHIPVNTEPQQEITLEPPKPKKKEKVALSILYPEIKSADRHNYRITDDNIGVGTPSVRYANNVAAIRLLKQLEAEERLATPDEQKTLSQYVGWGGLSDCFREDNSHYGELKELLTDDEYASAKESTLTAFYTPPVVIRSIYQALENMNFKVGNILEPSCGIGNFLGMLPESMNGSKLYGIEMDSVSGRIAQQLYQKSSVSVAPFERTNLPDSFFDAAIGNVPFGPFKVTDKKYDKHNFLIHDYFFARTLDKVRPGGIVAFVTSQGTMDKENPAVRKYIAQRADLIGAIRLPNNTFKGAAGTEVTSDIIFLQKRDRLLDIEPDWVHLNTDEKGIKMNEYFVNNPDMICGEMKMISGPHGEQSACIAYPDGDLSELLSDAIQNIHAEVVSYELDDLGEDEDDLSIPADPSVRNFSYCIYDGKVYYRENSLMYPKELSVTAENRVKGLVEIRDCVRRLIEYQTEDYPDSDIEAEQKNLNDLYDKFQKKYGIINGRANNSVFSDDSSYCLLCSLEVLDDEGNFVRKADMFSKRTIRQRVAITSVDTASEALSVSLSEKAKIDMPYMMQLTGKTENELFNDLKGVIFLDPKQNQWDDGERVYVTADEYLSGNVRDKLAWAEHSCEKNPDDYAENVKALKAVQPVDLTASEISVRLGATWLPTEVIEKFMFELFDTPRYCQWNIKVHFSEYSGEWNVEGKSYDRSNIKAYNTYGTSRINGYKIIEETLNLRDVRIFDYVEDENGRRTPVLNRKETAIAQGKQELIKQAFADWIWNDPTRREQLCEMYNTKFNSNRAREYDGSFLNFVGMNPEITLRKHQINAIARILLGGNSLLAHVVGAGKTFEMVAAAQESKRLGLCSKSLFVVPNHLTEQWASEYLQLYPSANILVATKKDFETKNRKKFCGRIATGDYDAIIIGHSQFEKIPMSPERQEIILNRQLEEITEGISELKRNHGDNFSVKQLEKAKKTIKQKLEKLNDQSRKDDVVTFEELGVDRIFIDEAHYYKNLASFSKMRNVGGISQTEAMKSSDLYMKCRYLDEMTDGRGVVFATGTPISNSMVEMFTMQKYLQYKALKDHNLLHFDSWASTFGETVTAIELAPEGTGYRAKTRFAKLYNLPELIMMFRDVADIQTADMLNLPVPKANYHTVALKPSEQQKDMVAELSERAEKVRNKMVASWEDNMLCITNDGRKLALDQRLLNELLPDSETSKVSSCANNVYEIWKKTEADRSTQMIFCDLSTPHGDGKFNVYDALRDSLIAKGIPAEEIAYIHDAKTEVQKKEMFGKVRSGQIRVILGSTQKMGAGTNVQKKLIALHHLDCPWRPADLQQREGRIIRQGNENSEVEIYSYVTEGTFDAYLYQLVESKQKFIGQIMTSKNPVRSADDVDEQALSYAEIKALASGNPHIKEKMDLDIEVARLKLLKSNHSSQRYALEDKILKELPQKIRSYEERIVGYEADIAHADENTHPNEDGFSPMVIKGVTYTEKKAAGEAIIAACKAMTKPEPIPLGEYRGFSLELSFEMREYHITMKNKLRHTVTLGTDIFGNVLRLDNAIAAFPERMIACKEQLEATQAQLESAKVEVAKPFPHEADLKAKTKRLDELNILLNMDKRENEIDDGERNDDDEPTEKSVKEKDYER